MKKKPLPLNELPPFDIPMECIESQKHAMRLLIVKGRRWRPTKAHGGARLGDIEIDVERMLLVQVEAAGSARGVRGLQGFLRALWMAEDSESERRLNQFLIRLGRALASPDKRTVLPDWKHMDHTVPCIVDGWCRSLCINGECWPPLCCLTTPVLVKLFKWTKTGNVNSEPGKDSRTLEKAIERHGLVRIPTGRLKFVEKRFGRLLFA
jgi:hypothetical protein